ncbi:protein of unknown function [Taphrina deformans PYCC 5710]|uniref:Peptidyl-tRNA hydrolase n=1 Tax=Taphrina deformans (strain PYCC 5710 / ATCC 11124 / CBS 356.35 / IMI 108563 / JCM 9778 / NBRC 8474) TaxID=1097556 RepID=R4XL94_TAPDE|nr:protein of unknown function [Taphrina deformans PYCC 5710]|eukprot:CCG84079.1 protein of unknown function [Taphrina deformans PYCC 5710]
MRGVISRKEDITLYQSGSYMNDSGSSILRAYQEFQKVSPEALLCVIHDEMESKLGAVKVRLTGKGKGHNGIRSCIKSLGTEDFARMAIGIDRPDSRESSIVTRWVLGKFTVEEKRTLEQESLMKMIAVLEKLQES